MTTESDSGIIDVAIVGAGVSGVYVGWRLLTSPLPDTGLSARISGAPSSGPPRVAIFEESSRVGGRLLSVQPPGVPETFCELGGMRFMSTQPYVSNLIQKRLNLATATFVVDEPENLNYLRGLRVRNRDLNNAALLPYDLTWSERQSPTTLLSDTVDRVIPGVTQMTSEQIRKFLATYKIDDMHVYDWGFWNLLARGMSHEAYELARVTMGYDTPMLNWNAADTISLNFDLTPNVSYLKVVGGYQSLPLTLRDQFVAANGELNMNHTLVSFTAGTLSDGSEGLVLTVLPHGKKDKGEPITVQARSLVLAMPRRSLELIEPVGPVLDRGNERVWDMIRSVTPIPLFKLCIAYDFPWWQAVGVTQGRTQTDLPIRQLYYWASAPHKGVDPDNCKSVLLATYDDGQNVAFWDGLAERHPRDPFQPKQDKYTREHPGSQEWHDYKASKAMVAEADRQLKQIHDLPYAPPPYAAAYIDWGVDPFGGGVNFWNVHVKSGDVITKMARPVPEVPVFVCGEAYSNGQGWVEGALETAELVLQGQLGLAPPEWVS